MKKIFLVFSFFTATQIILIVSIFFLLSFSYKQNESDMFAKQTHPVAFAALPSSKNTIQSEIVQENARVEIVKQFFEKYDSPLVSHASYIVETADQYDLDFRLIPAIAMQESNLCKYSPADSNNCWGFGIYGSTVTRFDSYEDAILAVTKTLALKYRPDGLITPYEIMQRYTPQSNGSWADGVEFFMDMLQ